MHVGLVRDPESDKIHHINSMAVAGTLSGQLSVMRDQILRADHVSRVSYLPNFAFSWIVSICVTIVLAGVKTTDSVQEYTLLPSLILFVYLFAMFMEEMDDPFDARSSVSVTLESLEQLHLHGDQMPEETKRSR